jgi:prepilin-type N-terminal cleavage/methylation domain-containing protein
MRMRRTSRTNTTPRRGVSLIELIASLVVLAIAVPATLRAIREAHRQRVDPVLADVAHWLAIERLEEVIADCHSPSRGWEYLLAANYPDEPTVEGFEAYSREVTLTETGVDLQTVGTGFMTVRVEVNWTSVSGAARALAVETVLTEYTLE